MAYFEQIIAAIERLGLQETVRLNRVWSLVAKALVIWKGNLCNMGVSKNGGTPKSSILIGIRDSHYKPSILGTPIFGNIHMFM